MKALSWVRARPKAVASAAAVTASAVAITTLALTYEGLPTTEVDLHDGGVWLTKSSSLLVGHFNHESAVLDGGLRTTGDRFDILQGGTAVLVVDEEQRTVTRVDPARVALETDAPLPGDAKVALGNNTVAILDRASGNLWVSPLGALGSMDIRGTDPVAELGRGADVAVGVDGTVHAVAAHDATVTTIPVDAEGAPTEPTSTPLGELSSAAQPSITVVGNTAVVYDDVAGTVLTTDGLRAEVGTGGQVVLQHVSADAAAVALATASDVVHIPLDGSEPRRTPAGAEGAPIAPVQLLGCTYGAWNGSGKFVRDCVGDDDDLSSDVEGLEPTSELTFRVNRDVIVLNDVVGGAAWLATESLQRVDNWNDITPPEGDSEEDEQTTEETIETTLPERAEKNTDPVAVNDQYGVRPGQSTMLPVLDNDMDADGDVLVATLEGDHPSFGEVAQIQNGGALQVAVDEDATGTSTFTYRVDDGRTGTDTANVRLTVHGWDTQNLAPAQKRQTAIAVEIGGTVSYNVLPDWIDPNGDDIYLRSVVPAQGDEVDFTTDGQITYRALGTLQGRKEVEVYVADGLGEIGVGTLIVDVRPQGSTLPKTNADHVVTRVGQPVTVAPLANDTSSGRDPLRLAQVHPVEGARIDTDAANKTFTFTADVAATYYVQYLVTAGPNAVPGLVRVDVHEPDDRDLAPVAVRDVALLPSGGEVLVGVLNNDTEPAGGILVVQSVTVDPGSRISVAVLNHETLRISDQGMLDEQVRISYRISNGSKTADGDVIVIPIPAPEKLLPPVANDDQVVVRAGDVVTIPVLANDTHPNDDKLHVAPDLVEPLIDPADGEAFVSQDTVRFRAGAEAKTVYATYEAVDATGQKDAGYITIQILPVDTENNAAPRPRDLTARVLSGAVVRIAVPLDGIDPDGDSIELMGLASSPTQGRIVEVGANYLDYEAFDTAAGVDSFRYLVRDRLGKEATATVRVGVAPPESMNQAPYAVKDSVVVRPGREVAVPVLLNDSDPEGERLTLLSDGLVVPDEEGLEARVVGERVVVTTPDRELETSIQYTIADARGLTARAVLQVTVDPDVPLIRPIARDDRVQPTDITDDLTVDVDVLTNDEDPDGTVDALDLKVEAAGTVLPDRTIRVTITEQLQLVRYTITDVDGQETSAFIFVPALADLRPTLLSTTPVEVKSGETIVLPLSEYVTVIGGGEVVITEADKVRAVHSNGASLIQDQRTLVYTSADRYFGQDAITFEVTDGTGPDDPAGRKSTLTIPITVLPPDNQQPTFTGSEVQVAPGEEAVSLDLRALTNDPDEGDLDRMRYEIVSGPGEGMMARIEGDTLFAEAAADTPKGTIGTVTLRITDGETDAIEGSVQVRVTASTRELAVANVDVEDDAHQGRTYPIDVLENDFNPFPETPLRVVAASTETGQGEVTFTDDSVEVTPYKDFVGSMVVRYRVQDATRDPDREVDGRITLTVKGVPDAPGTPSVSSVQDRTVVLSWTPPANNGAEITGYTVTSVQGNPYTKECAATTCTLNGLTNNVEYVFQVTATNAVGESPASPPSEVARPDARPDTPAAPTLGFRDRALDISWATPTTPGSPVEHFTLEISPPPPSGITQKTNVTGNSLVWEGLQNGVDYTVRVQAHNRAPEPSSWSIPSLPMTPAAPPDAPAAPTTVEATPVGNQPQMTVRWTLPADNGDTISGFEVRRHQGGNVVQTLSVSGSTTSQNFVVAASETGYTYTVRAINKAGPGAWSTASAERRGVLAPGAPSAVVANEGDRSITVAYTPGPRNGARANEIVYQYSLDGGNSFSALPSNNTIGGLTNNNSYQVVLRAVASVGGTTYNGAHSVPSNTAYPFGNPNAPSITGSVSQRTINWTISPGARNGVNISRIDWSDNRGNSGTLSAGGGSVSRTYAWSQSVTMTATVFDAKGQKVTQTLQRTTAAEPQPKIWVTRGDFEDAGCVNGCYHLRVNWENANLGSRQVYCESSAGRVSSNSYTVNFNGNGSAQLPCWLGADGYDVWVDVVGWGGSVDTEKRWWPRG